MSEAPAAKWYSPEQEELAQALHARYLQRDVTALSELAVLAFDLLQRELRKLHLRAVEDDLVDAASQAFESYMDDPTRYDPTRGRLLSYLLMAAKGDLRNIVDKHRRIDRREHEMPTFVAEDGSESEEEIEFSNDETTEEIVLSDLREGELAANVARLFTDETDRTIFWMWVHGVRETQEYALVLGITHLSAEDQRAMVKRTRDRIRVAAYRHRNLLLAGAEQTSHD